MTDTGAYHVRLSEVEGGDAADRSTVRHNHRPVLSVVPVAILRQAGFPIRLLDDLQDVDRHREASAIVAEHDGLVVLVDRLKAALRGVPAQHRVGMATRIGMLLPLSDREVSEWTDRAPAAVPLLQLYLERLRCLQRSVRGYDTNLCHDLDEMRRAIVATFADPALRDALLLSNDAHHAEFVDWLDRFDGTVDRRARRMVDLLTMYLQRFSAKNETHSHFGPITIARLDSTAPGVRWSTGELRRHAFWTHWAGERLATALTTDPELRESIRPRRQSLVFAEGRLLKRYAFTTTTGMPDTWRFVEQGRRPLDDEELWLWQACDGGQAVVELRRAWPIEYGRGFDDVLRGLVDDGWLIAAWEIPIGEAFPLRVLREHLSEHAGTEAAARGTAVVAGFEHAVADFAASGPQRRPELLASVKTQFERVTGVPANRSGGRHYADRSVLFEEALGEVQALVVGAELTRFLTEELSVVYDLALLGPRLRMRREREILRRWVEQHFGPDIPVPLGRFYETFFADREALDERCRQVDAELGEVDRQLTALLLADIGPGRREVEVPRTRLEEFLAGFPGEPPALCNPDVMFAARNRHALATGDFTAVVGDCHALREVLTHSSIAPILASDAPELLPSVYAGYQRLLERDETLVDLCRSHPDKTGAQLAFPCPDLEAPGRSPKPRDRVLHPDQLHLVARHGRIELRAAGVAGRIRLMAPLAGGPGIRQDPLSPFSFPRRAGGIGLRADDHAHLPRITCGRIVLQRERWRVPAAELRGWKPAATTPGRDAAELLSACRLQRELRLPRRCFAKIPGEPKPVFVDWTAPLLVRQLFRLVRSSTGTVELTELLPGPDELWLTRGEDRYTSELRCAVFSR